MDLHSNCVSSSRISASLVGLLVAWELVTGIQTQLLLLIFNFIHDNININNLVPNAINNYFCHKSLATVLFIMPIFIYSSNNRYSYSVVKVALQRHLFSNDRLDLAGSL